MSKPLLVLPSKSSYKSYPSLCPTFFATGVSSKQVRYLPPPSLQSRDLKWVLVLPTTPLLTLQTTLSIHPTIAVIRIRTMHCLLSKQNMPHVFQQSPAIVIIQLGIYQPLPNLDINVFLVFPNGGSRDCELGAACCSHFLGNWQGREEVVESRCVEVIEDLDVRVGIVFQGIEVRRRCEVHCDGTALEPVAAQTDIALFVNVV